MKTIRLKVSDFLYGMCIAFSGECDYTRRELLRQANAGTYPGTGIPLRKIPASAVVTVRSDGKVTDGDGGWIADRLADGQIGRRMTVSMFKLAGVDIRKRNRGRR